MDALNAADWSIITVVGVSTLLSLLRGFVKEALSLIGWVLAFIVAMVFADRFAYLLDSSIANPTGRYIVAFAVLFVLTLIAVALAARLLQKLRREIGIRSPGSLILGWHRQLVVGVAKQFEVTRKRRLCKGPPRLHALLCLRHPDNKLSGPPAWTVDRRKLSGAIK